MFSITEKNVLPELREATSRYLKKGFQNYDLASYLLSLGFCHIY